jgi:aspartoacylase
MKKIKKVVITGGTHGNEFTGVYLVKKILKNKKILQRKYLKVDALITNKKAFQKNKRYVDQDLNRSFLKKDLKNKKLQNYENKLARKLQTKLIEKDNYDFLIDLHTSTANMGITIIISEQDKLALLIAGILQTEISDIKILVIPKKLEETSLSSIFTNSLEIEIGPIAQGIVSAEILLKTEKIVLKILDILEKINQQKNKTKFKKIITYNFNNRVIDYPRDKKGNIIAMIHPNLQNKDYQPLKTGSPLFLTFDNEIIYYEKKKTVYPVFINEAAYYEKGIAMMLTEKKMQKYE